MGVIIYIGHIVRTDVEMNCRLDELGSTPRKVGVVYKR